MSAKLRVRRVFSTEGIDPYSEVQWEKRDIIMTNWRDGTVNFEQKGTEFPNFWSVNASQIVASKYFRGTIGTSRREGSLKQLINRVVNKYVETGKKEGYFTSDKDSVIFKDELTWLLLHQYFSFNSPVWFNVGTSAPQQVSACFILSVDDSMESILNWYTEEGRIFKRGSGAGVNLSKIRGSHEGLSTGGRASGPVSFMRGADASAGTIASGGATRRAAKMVVLDIDHPDIKDFINCKMREEEKIRVLRDAGFDMDLDGKDVYSVQYQNANNSVRVSDKFMYAVEQDKAFDLIGRKTGKPTETVQAKELFDQVAKAAWACADPGIQYDDTINAWHTVPNDGKITASNPCSEYMSIDNSSCNLASINLMKFLGDDGKFDYKKFTSAVELIITAMELSVTFGDFPTDPITENTRKYRQLGIGYANLGALLMAEGLPYDSVEGRTVAAAITSLMTAVAYRRSAEIAGAVGPYAAYKNNEMPHTFVMQKHENASRKMAAEAIDLKTIFNTSSVFTAANKEWSKGIELGQASGWRNSQASLLAPTGTIGFMMDCDTTGIEPDFSLVKFKKLVGGGSMQIVNQTVNKALKVLGYNAAEIDEITEYVKDNGKVVGAPHLKDEHLAVFDCAVGERAIEPMGHVRMMAAVQPFLSGAISKTVNMPEEATIDDIKEVYMQSWKMGLKALAIYRNNCKVGQPLSDKKDEKKEAEPVAGQLVQTALMPDVTQVAQRRKMPKQRKGATYSFAVAGSKGYITTGLFPEGKIGEVFLKMAKQGSTLSGIMDAFAIAVSIGLQYGVPLETYVKKFINIHFEPAGMTDDPDIKFARSPIDYIFKRLAIDYMDFDDRSMYGIYTTSERQRAIETGRYEPDNVEEQEEEEKLETVAVIEAKQEEKHEKKEAHSTAELVQNDDDAPYCMNCGIKMRPAGTCHICESCGSSSGCS